MKATTIDTRIRQVRVASGLSAPEIARRVGVDLSYWCRLERGERAGSVEVLRRAAVELGVTVDALLGPLEAMPA